MMIMIVKKKIKVCHKTHKDGLMKQILKYHYPDNSRNHDYSVG